MTMTAQRNQQSAPAQTTQAAGTADNRTEFEKLLDRDFKLKTEFVPFLSTKSITLSPQIVIRYLCRRTKSGQSCSEEQAIRFIKLCESRGLDPWQGDAYIVGYDTKDGPEFNLITAHQAFLKRAEVHPEYDGMESGVVVTHSETDEIRDLQGDFIPEDCKLVGGWAKVHFKNRKVAIYRRLNVETFDKGFANWSSNKAGMIVKCAEADALRSSFPNSLGGMYLENEMPGVTTSTTAAATGNAPKPGASKTENLVGRLKQSDNLDSAAAEAPVQPAQTVSSTTTSKATAASANASPSWDELKNQGITYFQPEGMDGVVVMNADGAALKPDGKWDAEYTGPTTCPHDAEHIEIARQMAVKALATLQAPPAPAADAPAPASGNRSRKANANP